MSTLGAIALLALCTAGGLFVGLAAYGLTVAGGGANEGMNPQVAELRGDNERLLYDNKRLTQENWMRREQNELLQEAYLQGAVKALGIADKLARARADARALPEPEERDYSELFQRVDFPVLEPGGEGEVIDL